jgi:chromate transporter
LGGPLGGVTATLGVFLPSFLMVLCVSPYFDRLRSSLGFDNVANGILCSFIGLLLTVTIRFALNVQWDVSHLLLASGSLIALLLNVDIHWVVMAGTGISMMLFM